MQVKECINITFSKTITRIHKSNVKFESAQKLIDDVSRLNTYRLLITYGRKFRYGVKIV